MEGGWVGGSKGVGGWDQYGWWMRSKKTTTKTWTRGR